MAEVHRRPLPPSVILDSHIGQVAFPAGEPQNPATFDYFRVTR